jgi:hypothetical protein
MTLVRRGTGHGFTGPSNGHDGPAQQGPGVDAVGASCLFLRLWPRGSGAALDKNGHETATSSSADSRQ